MRRAFAIASFLTAAALLAGCSSLPPAEQWPDDLPPRSEFVTAYDADPDNAGVQALDDYLTWIIRFYDGNGMVGTSWREVSEGIVAGLEGDELTEARGNLRRMGQLIAAEWAKANEVRVINTRMLSLWGSVMLAADNPEDRLVAMTLINRDVQDLLRGKRDPRSITEPRYEEALAISLGF